MCVRASLWFRNRYFQVEKYVDVCTNKSYVVPYCCLCLCCVLQTILAYLSFVRHELCVRHLPHCIPFCYVSVGVIKLKHLILWSSVLASKTKQCFSVILDFLLSCSSICNQEQLLAFTFRVNYLISGLSVFLSVPPVKFSIMYSLIKPNS